MFKRLCLYLILLTNLFIVINSVQLIIKPNRPTCTVLISSFDPIKVQAFFPAINKLQDQKFKITLINDKTKTIAHQTFSQDNKTFRNNYHLDNNIVYSLCFQFVTKRSNQTPIMVGFKAEEHFEKMNDDIIIPNQLANETNLKIIYATSKQLLQEVNVTISHQKKQRQLQDQLADLSMHKTQRIITITTIQCLIILICALYQIFALRKFLIDKNLY